MLLVATIPHRNVSMEIIFDLFFFPPMRVTVTTGRLSLLKPPDKLNLLSNLGS